MFIMEQIVDIKYIFLSFVVIYFITRTFIIEPTVDVKPESIFNSQSVLNNDDQFEGTPPQPTSNLPLVEDNNDWFNCVPELDKKNKHLIKIKNPTGVTNIGGSSYTTTHDVQKKVIPKFKVSPWVHLGNTNVSSKPLF